MNPTARAIYRDGGVTYDGSDRNLRHKNCEINVLSRDRKGDAIIDNPMPKASPFHRGRLAISVKIILYEPILVLDRILSPPSSLHRLQLASRLQLNAIEAV